jgi:hypothetical protein
LTVPGSKTWQDTENRSVRQTMQRVGGNLRTEAFFPIGNILDSPTVEWIFTSPLTRAGSQFQALIREKPALFIL